MLRKWDIRHEREDLMLSRGDALRRCYARTSHNCFDDKHICVGGVIPMELSKVVVEYEKFIQ